MSQPGVLPPFHNPYLWGARNDAMMYAGGARAKCAFGLGRVEEEGVLS